MLDFPLVGIITLNSVLHNVSPFVYLKYGYIMSQNPSNVHLSSPIPIGQNHFKPPPYVSWFKPTIPLVGSNLPFPWLVQTYPLFHVHLPIWGSKEMLRGSHGDGPRPKSGRRLLCAAATRRLTHQRFSLENHQSHH